MYCPDDKRDVDLSEGSPQVDRLRIDGTNLRADVEIIDLCGTCSRTMQSTKMKVERSLVDAQQLKGHLGVPDHKLLAEVLKNERLHETPGFGAVKLVYGLTCSCGNLKMHEGVVFGSGILMPNP